MSLDHATDEGGDVGGRVRGLDDEGDVERGEGVGEGREVAQPEVDLGGGVVVRTPLAGGDDVERDEAVVGEGGGGEEGGVVVDAEVAAKPDEGTGHRWHWMRRRVGASQWLTERGHSAQVAPR